MAGEGADTVSPHQALEERFHGRATLLWHGEFSDKALEIYFYWSDLLKPFFILAINASLFGSLPAIAAPLFDFEGAVVTDSLGGYSGLSQTSNGLTATFTRPGSNFDIDNANLNGGAPASFGTHSLSPFYDPSNAPFIVSFSTALKMLSFEAGDFAQDSDTISLSIFSGLNGTGTLLQTVTYNYGFGSFPDDVASLSVNSATPFLSAVFIGGSTEYPNSVYYDNFAAIVSVVPLPSSLSLFGFSILSGVLWTARFKRSAARDE